MCLFSLSLAPEPGQASFLESVEMKSQVHTYEKITYFEQKPN